MGGERLTTDPRWQRRRLEILTRDNYTCQNCGATDKTLHVHHKHYVTGRAYWEYEDWELTTLCEGCHCAEHLVIPEIPKGEKTDLDYERDGLVARLDQHNFRQIMPRIMEIDRQQYATSYSKKRAAG